MVSLPHFRSSRYKWATHFHRHLRLLWSQALAAEPGRCRILLKRRLWHWICNFTICFSDNRDSKESCKTLEPAVFLAIDEIFNCSTCFAGRGRREERFGVIQGCARKEGRIGRKVSVEIEPITSWYVGEWGGRRVNNIQPAIRVVATDLWYGSL